MPALMKEVNPKRLAAQRGEDKGPCRCTRRVQGPLGIDLIDQCFDSLAAVRVRHDEVRVPGTRLHGQLPNKSAKTFNNRWKRFGHSNATPEDGALVVAIARAPSS